VHDVGAGGLSNALPELVHGAGRGARIDLAAIPVLDSSMSPLEIWCNESQERYVLAIEPDRLDEFAALCERERCPYAVLGVATAEDRLVVARDGERAAVDMPVSTLLGRVPPAQRDARSVPVQSPSLQASGVDPSQAAVQVLRHPTVASKSFLITIGDRSVGGLCSRDQMVGPWQMPVADCAVTLADYEGYAGDAFAMGERHAAGDRERGGGIACRDRRSAVEPGRGRRRFRPREAVGPTGWPRVGNPGRMRRYTGR